MKEESFPELNRVVELMNDHPSISIEISGNTDNIGSNEVNQKLSQERSLAVVHDLTSKSRINNRLVGKDYRETVPPATKDSEEGRELNRRVEFRILKKKFLSPSNICQSFIRHEYFCTLAPLFRMYIYGRLSRI